MASETRPLQIRSEVAQIAVQPLSIAAVVVTFNRKTLLAECLDALLSQSRALDRIYVVDQASSDGTAEMLQERGYRDHPSIIYYRSPKNTGGAGGFQRGIELAYEGGSDWIWIMDDDAIAEPDALDKMLRYILHPKVSAIANQKIRRDGTPDTGHFTFEKGGSASANPALLTFSSFVGLMVSKTAVAAIGFPKAEFFLQGDDTEYCIRLCKAGKIVFAPDSVLVHKEVSRPPELIHRFGRDFTIYPKDRFCFQYFMWRNRVWIEVYARGFRPDRVAWLATKIFRVCIRTCLVDREDLGFRLFILFRAIRDGVLGRFDNDFPFRMREQVIGNASR